MLCMGILILGSCVFIFRFLSIVNLFTYKNMRLSSWSCYNKQYVNIQQLLRYVLRHTYARTHTRKHSKEKNYRIRLWNDLFKYEETSILSNLDVKLVCPFWRWPSLLGLYNIPTASLQRRRTSPTTVLDMTLRNLMMRLQ